MKTNPADTRWLYRAAMVATLAATLHQAAAQGTAFTYQGQLHDNGTPASGSYDLRFTIYPSANGGSIIGNALTNTAVAVSNGFFTVTLDFGASVFTGQPRWLELGATTNGNPGLETLAPRQKLLPTPYAMYAGNSASVVSGAVVQSLNGLRDNLTLAAGANVTITPSGNTLTIASSGGGGSSVWNLNGADAYFTGGKVGVGTTTPRGALHVASGGFAVTGASSPYSGAGAGIFMEGGTNGGFLYAFDYGPFLPKPLLLNSPGGNVGIGTTTPGSKLEVIGDVATAIYGRSTAVSGVGVYGESSQFNGVRGLAHNAAHGGVVGVHDGGGIAVYGTGSTGVQGDSSSISGFGGYFRNTAAGVALGVEGKTQLLGQDALQLIGYQPFLTLYDSSSGYAAGRIQSVAGDVNFFTQNYLTAADPNSYAKLFNSGTFSVKTLNIRGGADLAEPFEFSDKDIAKGSVLVIDDEQPGKLKLSTRAYDRRVAGIVSGANGINPGISLHQDGVLDSGQNVALSGRVYVQADASFGAIKPGDLLTTSSTPGHAMKVSNHIKAQGAILGKAMSALKTGKGTVLVLVTLQ